MCALRVSTVNRMVVGSNPTRGANNFNQLSSVTECRASLRECGSVTISFERKLRRRNPILAFRSLKNPKKVASFDRPPSRTGSAFRVDRRKDATARRGMRTLVARTVVAPCAYPAFGASDSRRIFSFLPILGIWMLPLGLLLIAQDVPFLQQPLASALGWVERKWMGRKD